MFAIEKNPRLARFPVAVQQSKEVVSESLKNLLDSLVFQWPCSSP